MPTSEKLIDVDRLLLQQRELFKQLHKTVINHSKCGQSRRTLGYFNARLEALSSLFDSIKSNHSKLVGCEDPEVEAYNNADEFSAVEEIFITYKSDLLDGKELLIQQQQPSVNNLQAAPQLLPVVENHNEFRLPTISVPVFNGDYNHWPSYKNSFQHLVANNNSLSNLQRLHYLKNSLAGDAKRLVAHYDIVDANYQAAWDKLILRYDNKKLLIKNHIKALLHQPAQSRETAAHLRSLIDVTTDSLNGLRTLDVPVNEWDPIINHLILESLPIETHSLWESSQASENDIPELATLLKFLENRFRTLEAIAEKPSQAHKNPFHKQLNPQSRANNQSYSHVAASDYSCILCKDQHYLRSCPSFLRLNVNDRLNFVHQHRVCSNCLVPGHTPRLCRNKMNCAKCHKRHHTLLHLQDSAADFNPETSSTNTRPAVPSSNIIPNSNPFNTRQPTTIPPSTPNHGSSCSNSRPAIHSSNSNPGTSLANSQHHVGQYIHTTATDQSLSPSMASTSLTHLSNPIPNRVLLGTACVNVANSSGDLITLRALIDPGSQSSFITMKAVQRLQLQTVSTNARVFGIGQTYSGTSTKQVHLTFQSTMDPNIHITSNFLTIPQITGAIPQETYLSSQFPHIQNLRLADPSYYKSCNVDLLLSAEIYAQIILPGLQKGQPNEPIAQNTLIGWILVGGSPSPWVANNLSLHTCVDIDSRLRAFWESEEISSPSKPSTHDDVISETHFQETYSRDQNGRFVVRLPFTSTLQTSLGASRENAIQRLLQIERKLQKDPNLAKEYTSFMNEYESLGHMLKVPENSNSYYIPHHPVFKQSSSTTKLRVVFDASRKTSSGFSLNDCLRIGPTIQDDLTTLLTRWRKFPIAFSADLEKMYRQIRINTQDLDFQRILWRNSPTEKIQDYQLQTITYGTACAQYLAIRSVHQLAQDGMLSHPLASQRMLTDFYVDDLLSGAYDVNEATVLQSQLRDLFSTGGFNLRKWASNHDEILQSIPLCDREIKTTHLIEFDETIKSLGIHWNPRSDQFTFQNSLDKSVIANTKRTILSEISKLFDPLGWLAPLVIRAKILMQQIWCLDLNWDDHLPPSILESWRIIRENLQTVEIISIPRSIAHIEKDHPIELHGFSDASTHAYAAVVYARIIQPDGLYKITLLAAKTKVSPIKQVTLPRLELCGAHLLSKLISKVSSDIQVTNVTSYAWCDSSIVLHWMHGHPNRLKTFVANRVSDIMECGNIKQWRHISGKENPADCATRGLDTNALLSHPLWWHGPPWLSQNRETWPTSLPPLPESLPDVKITSLTVDVVEPILDNLINSFSSLTPLTRIVALLKRFVHNTKNPKNRITGNLTATELKSSLNHIIRIVQSTEFSLDYRNLQSKSPLHHRSSLLSLNPFLDDTQIMRLGGRLENAIISFNSKHPIILPKSHHITKLIIRQAHLNTLHGGPELVITTLRQQYWIISMRNAVRQETHRCIKCFRFKAVKCEQLMGNLPKPRVAIDRAFTHTGVDCAGPIDIRMSKGRGAKSHKGYIALFVCLCTKAVHIEAISDMSTPAFLAAYRRFSARRGLPHHMYSDNGTNFVGAAKIIRKQAGTHLLNVTDDIINEVSNIGSEWHFIPPSSPHFGGLWEAGIKSMKYHLKRIIGDSTLTFEEISTVLTQIEACLNSRPLCPTTSDPSDNSALTPGHFIIGDAILSPPEVTSELSNINHSTRWQFVQKMRNDFWKRWQREYISRLQQRPKWATQTANINKNDMVLIMEDNLPPTRWLLGRVIETHPGKDGLVRVVTIRCKNSTIKRPINKLALLPISH